jgi:hypothetical protein
MILGVASSIIAGCWDSIYPESTFWQPLWAKEITTWSYPQSGNERQQSINDLVCYIWHNPEAGLRHLAISQALAAFIGNIVCIDTATPHNECQYSINRAWTEHQQSINTASIECQQSGHDFVCCIMYNPRAVLWHIPRINVLAAVMSKRYRDMVTAPVRKWASTERQRLSLLHLK